MQRRERLVSLFLCLLVLMSCGHTAHAQLIDAVVGAHPYGGAFGAIAGAGGTDSVPGSEFAKRGFSVHIERMVGSGDEAWAALMAGKLDALVLSTDMVARLAVSDTAGKVKTLLLTSYSQGSLGIVARDGYTTPRSLAGARISVPENSPSHYYLARVLRAFGVDPEKVGLVLTKTTEQAFTALRGGDADAAVLWTPFLTRALNDPAYHLISSTQEGNQLISSVLVARTEWLTRYARAVPNFIAAWMAGAQRTESDVTESTRVIHQALGLDEDEVRDTLARTRLTRLQDNVDFFSPNEDSRFIRYEREIGDARAFWQSLRVVPAGKLPVRPSVAKEHMMSLARIAPPEAGTGVRTYVRPRSSPLAKNVYFADNQVVLDANAKEVVRSFAEDEAHGFANSRIRIEGNADLPTTGRPSRALQRRNLEVSVQRAMAVANELISVHGIDPDRLVVVGNGARLNGQTEGNNRRTEFFFE